MVVVRYRSLRACPPLRHCPDRGPGLGVVEETVSVVEPSGGNELIQVIAAQNARGLIALRLPAMLLREQRPGLLAFDPNSNLRIREHGSLTISA